MDEARRSLTPRRLVALAALVAIPAGCVIATSTSTGAHQAPTTSTAPVVTTISTSSTTTPISTSTTTTQPAPVVTVAAQPSTPAPAVQGCYADLAVQVGWPADAIAHLVTIIERESHCDPSSNTGYRPSTGDWSIGLLQINTLGSLLEARQAACAITSREQLLDPATNLRCGLALYNQSGFAPWGG